MISRIGYSVLDYLAFSFTTKLKTVKDAVIIQPSCYSIRLKNTTKLLKNFRLTA